MVQVIKEQAICLDEFGELLISKDSVHMLIVKESDTTIGARKYRFIKFTQLMYHF